jgi:hypothetical protein
MTLCFSSIIGSTLALFTNDPERGKIGVNTTSGKVKVDIVDTSKEENSLVGDALQFMTTSQSDTYYIEPGATIYTQGFRVKNIGNVTMNYHLYVSDDRFLNMANFDDVFDVYITTDIDNAKNAEKLMSFIGRLEAGKTSDTYFLVLKMKENATNDFQNKKYSGIGITVYAIQGNVEIKE